MQRKGGTEEEDTEQQLCECDRILGAESTSGI